MTRIVDGLERTGLAGRRPHPRDGRAVLVRASRKGRRIMERGRQNRVDLISGILERLGDEELRAVEGAVEALARALEVADP